MALREMLKRNTYQDSITLMMIARVMKEQPGVEDAGAVMATAANCQLLREADLLPAMLFAEQGATPGPNDLLVVVRATDDEQADAALDAARQLLSSRSGGTPGNVTELPARSLEAALRRDGEANLVVVAVAGEHAWLEAEQALNHGLHVFLFSDNVPIEHEKRLKDYAIKDGLLLMGPDCGTAIINGVGLGFSNVVPRGSIGIVGASGTGMQELICLVAAAGMGISQAIGTGGRDLSEAIGGVMTLQGLKMLAADPQTAVIVLVSKPPAERVAREVLAAAQLVKPVIAIFLGAEPDRFASTAGAVHMARTLTEGAGLAVSLAGGNRAKVPGRNTLLKYRSQLAAARAGLSPTQRYIRALYAGGTLCDEAMLLLSERVGVITSNIPLQPQWALIEGETFRGHTALDLGADEFTRGRPHPMIDPTLRLHYFTRAAGDPETAVILLDIVLGFCSYQNPAAIYGPAITRARRRAAEVGHTLPVIISLCGTEGDPQGLSRQREAFEDAGAFVFESNVEAALAAASFVSNGTQGSNQQAEEIYHG